MLNLLPIDVQVAAHTKRDVVQRKLRELKERGAPLSIVSRYQVAIERLARVEKEYKWAEEDRLDQERTREVNMFRHLEGQMRTYYCWNHGMESTAYCFRERQFSPVS